MVTLRKGAFLAHVLSMQQLRERLVLRKKKLVRSIAPRRGLVLQFSLHSRPVLLWLHCEWCLVKHF